MKAKSIQGKTTEEIHTALQQSMSDARPDHSGGNDPVGREFKPTLAVVFMSIQMDVREIQRILNNEGIVIFGVSTAGEFTNSGIEKGSAAILLLEISEEYFSVVFEDLEGRPTKEMLNDIGREGKNAFEHPAVIIAASDNSTPGSKIVEWLIEVLGPDVTIVGGVAGDDLTMEGGFIFTNQQCCRQGIMALFLDGNRIDVLGQAVSGWKPVGTPKKITASKDNWIYTIDNQPAMDMLVRFTGLKINTNNPADLYQQIGLSFPLQIIREKGQPTMIPPMMYNPSTGAIQCAGNIPEGSMMRFSLPPDFEVIDTVIDSARQIRNSVSPEVDAMIIFSCIGRLNVLGPLIDEEIDGLKAVWDVPLAGFFCYGEFGRTEGGNTDFHGGTCSWVALKEVGSLED